jgi:hypothetical protein
LGAPSLVRPAPRGGMSPVATSNFGLSVLTTEYEIFGRRQTFPVRRREFNMNKIALNPWVPEADAHCEFLTTLEIITTFSELSDLEQ